MNPQADNLAHRLLLYLNRILHSGPPSALQQLMHEAVHFVIRGGKFMRNKNLATRIASAFASLAILLAAIAFAGCERKERVLDVRTPAGDVKVDRNIDNGKVEVQTNNR